MGTEQHFAFLVQILYYFFLTEKHHRRGITQSKSATQGEQFTDF